MRDDGDDDDDDDDDGDDIDDDDDNDNDNDNDVTETMFCHEWQSKLEAAKEHTTSKTSTQQDNNQSKH